MKKLYRVDTNNGRARSTTTKTDAFRVTRNLLGASRLYRGAEYQTSRTLATGETENVTAVDIWLSQANAKQQSNGLADAVISWYEY